MKQLALTLALVLSTAAAFGAPSILRKSGDCKLKVGDTFDDSKAFKVELANSDVQITSNFHGGDFFDDFMLFANPSIDNKSGRKLSVAYYVAFFDKAGDLIGTAGQSGDLDVDAKGYQFGSCMAKITQAEFARITSYKVVVYVDNAKPE